MPEQPAVQWRLGGHGRTRSSSLARALALTLGLLGWAACAPADRAADDLAAADDGTAVETSGVSGLEQLSGEVDRTRVAVMPFDVSGAESALAYLESALPVLLSRKLGYPDPPDAIFDATDLESARRQALAAGAGNVVMGAVVGNPNRLTIRASLRLTRTGRVMAEESVTGGLDSLDVLTSRLALQLALRGVDPGARELIASTARPVIDATLEGFLALWQFRGPAAAGAFQAALALDSTFGIAAEGLYDIVTDVRINAGLDRAEVTRLAESLLHRSTAAHRAFWEAEREPDSIRIPNMLERIRRWEAAAAAHPTHPWIWNHLAYLYYWNGAYAGIEDWHDRALRAFTRAEESMAMEPCVLRTHVLLRQVEPDPAELSEYAESCRPEEQQTPFLRNWQRLLRAAILRDTAELRRIRTSAAIDSMGDGQPWFQFYFVQAGYGVQEWRAAIDRSERNATRERQRHNSEFGRLLLARVTGRPGEASQYLRERLASGFVQDPWFVLSLPIESALLEPGWEEIAVEAGSRTMNPDPSWGDTLRVDTRSGGRNNSFDRLCYSEMARLVVGDTSQTRASVATLRHLRESELPRRQRACPELLDAVREGISASSEPRGLNRLDSLMSLAPGRDVLDRSVVNLVMARLYWARGDAAAAWKWVRRRSWNTATARIMPAWLRSEGRFAVAVGEREHAIRAYRQYLVLREDPERVLVPQRDSVLAELECIDAEMADRRDPGMCAALLGDS